MVFRFRKKKMNCKSLLSKSELTSLLQNISTCNICQLVDEIHSLVLKDYETNLFGPSCQRCREIENTKESSGKGVVSNNCHLFAKENRTTFCKQLRDSGRIFSILLDQNYIADDHLFILIYIRCSYEDSLQNFFFDLIHINKLNRKKIFERIVDTFHEHGIDNVSKLFKEQLVGYATDGGSNLLATYEEIGDSLKEYNPDLIVVHCLGHKLEIVLQDILNSDALLTCIPYEFTLFVQFVNDLYEDFLLSDINNDAFIDIIIPKFDWDNLNYFALVNIIENYTGLVNFLRKNSNERSERILYIMQSWSFPMVLGLLTDISSLLHELTVYLQNESISVLQFPSVLDILKKKSPRYLERIQNEYNRSGTCFGETILKPLVLSDKSEGFKKFENNLRKEVNQYFKARLPDFDTLKTVGEKLNLDGNSQNVGLLQRFSIIPISSHTCKKTINIMNTLISEDSGDVDVDDLSAIMYEAVNHWDLKVSSETS